jgi:geranylgeranyl pyrophosphate synthase
MTWEALLDQYSELIDRKVKEYFEALKVKVAKYHSFMLRTYENLEEYVLRRGKRLASCSTLLTYKGYMGEVDEKILNVCVGVELYRHCILLHDDVVDEDEMRRGGKSFHMLFPEVGGLRFGEGVAIFVGDLVYALSLETIRDSGFIGEPLQKVLRSLTEGYREVNESQVLDLFFEHKEPSVEEWYTMASRRAASLFKFTILSGATLGGAPGEDLRALGEAATHIGYAFDIQDDLIDTFADEQQYGRPPGGDLARGKKPLAVIYTLQLANREELKALKNLLAKGKLTENELDAVRTLMRQTGALEKTRQKAEEHARKAKTLATQTKMSEEGKSLFNSFVDYITQSLEWYK